MKIKVSIIGEVNGNHSLNILSDFLNDFTDDLFALSLRDEIVYPIIRRYKNSERRIKVRIDKDESN